MRGNRNGRFCIFEHIGIFRENVYPVGIYNKCSVKRTQNRIEYSLCIFGNAESAADGGSIATRQNFSYTFAVFGGNGTVKSGFKRFVYTLRDCVAYCVTADIRINHAHKPRTAAYRPFGGKHGGTRHFVATGYYRRFAECTLIGVKRALRQT